MSAIVRDVGRDVLADPPVATGRGLHEPPVLVAQAHRQPVDLELAHEPRHGSPSRPARPPDRPRPAARRASIALSRLVIGTAWTTGANVATGRAADRHASAETRSAVLGMVGLEPAQLADRARRSRRRGARGRRARGRAGCGRRSARAGRRCAPRGRRPRASSRLRAGIEPSVGTAESRIDVNGRARLVRHRRAPTRHVANVRHTLGRRTDAVRAEPAFGGEQALTPQPRRIAAALRPARTTARDELPPRARSAEAPIGPVGGHGAPRDPAAVLEEAAKVAGRSTHGWVDRQDEHLRPGLDHERDVGVCAAVHARRRRTARRPPSPTTARRSPDRARAGIPGPSAAERRLVEHASCGDAGQRRATAPADRATCAAHRAHARRRTRARPAAPARISATPTLIGPTNCHLTGPRCPCRCGQSRNARKPPNWSPPRSVSTGASASRRSDRSRRCRTGRASRPGTPASAWAIGALGRRTARQAGDRGDVEGRERESCAASADRCGRLPMPIVEHGSGPRSTSRAGASSTGPDRSTSQPPTPRRHLRWSHLPETSQRRFVPRRGRLADMSRRASPRVAPWAVRITLGARRSRSARGRSTMPTAGRGSRCDVALVGAGSVVAASACSPLVVPAVRRAHGAPRRRPTGRAGGGRDRPGSAARPMPRRSRSSCWRVAAAVLVAAPTSGGRSSRPRRTATRTATCCAPPLAYAVADRAHLAGLGAALLVGGPLLLGGRHWIRRGARRRSPLAVARWAWPRWHRLSRRWFVLVPVGVVLHDHVVLGRDRDVPAARTSRRSTSPRRHRRRRPHRPAPATPSRSSPASR